MSILLIAALLSPALAADAPKSSKKEKTPMEWTGSFSPIEQPEQQVIKTEAEWKAVWQKLGKPAPAVDLKKHFAVAVFLGMKPTGGYSVEWKPAGAVIRYKVQKPKGMAIEALTYPYAIKLFDRSGITGEIRVEAAHD